MKRPSVSRPRRRLVLLALLVPFVIGGGVRAALASGSCADTCIGAFGISFYNSRGDYFLLKDCATSDISGTTYCTYARLPAMT